MNTSKLVASYIQALTYSGFDNSHNLDQKTVEFWVRLIELGKGPMAALHLAVHDVELGNDDDGVKCYEAYVPNSYSALWEMEFESGLSLDLMAIVIATVFLDTRPDYIRRAA